MELARQIIEQLEASGASERIHVVFGGIIPPNDIHRLEELGVKRVFTPSDYELIDIMESIADVIDPSGS